MENQRARRFLPNDDTSTASWNESLHINRGKESVADDLQKVVRHHRKDDDSAPENSANFERVKKFESQPYDEQQLEDLDEA